jgi:hypothetical protein
MTPPSSTAAAVGTSTGTPASITTSSISTNILSTTPTLITLPTELQLNLLTYLRAYDLVHVQQVCQHFCNPVLIHKIVQHTAEHVYPPAWTAGFDQQPLTGTDNGTVSKRSKPSSSRKSTTRKTSTVPKSTTAPNTTGDETEEDDIQGDKYTFEHLHNMELLVVARVLSRPEPATGYFVSKSWCKSALRWLELQQEDSRKNKKISKKKQRLRERRLSDVSPPWLNVNSDLLCEHRCLSRCSSGKSARARRKLLDKQTWKILKKLYPDSTQLESAVGECLHCTQEEESARKNERDRVEHAKLERKRPLANEAVRQFYTRTRGFPVHCLRSTDDVDGDDKQGDKKMPALGHGTCPLLPGIYQVLPRAWCHAWRRYIKTGEGQHPFPAPDAASLLCDEHRLPLLPPHLEAYLYGDSQQLLVAGTSSHGDDAESSTATAAAEASILHRPFVPGQAMDLDTLNALRAAGLSESEVASQLDAMRNLEVRNNAASAVGTSSQPSASLHTKNELLDQENHSVVELLTQEEFTALEESWPEKAHVFCLRVAVDAQGKSTFSTPQCRACDATGRQDALLSVRNRSRSRMSAERALVKANLEY